MGATMVLKEGYPCLEPLVNLSEPTRKLLTAYDTVSKTNEDGVHRDVVESEPTTASASHLFVCIVELTHIHFIFH